MLFRLLTALIATACALSCAAAQPCGADLRGAQTIESEHYVLAYRTQPAKIVVSKHFSIDFVTCAKGNAPAPDGVSVDAFMPEHGHGMNYKAAVKPAGSDNKAASKPVKSPRFRADGLMFHMPGRWDLTFDVQGAGKTERLTRSIVIE
jgi:hypothetical protein